MRLQPWSRVARWFIFQPKIPIWVNFERPYIDWKMLIYSMAIWNIYRHLWYFMIILNILCSFGRFSRFWYQVPIKIWQPCHGRAATAWNLFFLWIYADNMRICTYMVPKRRGEGRSHKAGKSATEITFEQSFEEKLNGSITRFPRQSPLEMFESNEFWKINQEKS
jgi:hypothetical protein